MAHGPQRYPKANTSRQWYAKKYPGDHFEANVGVLHTTEGTSWPGYSGGAVAPTLTARPNFAHRRLDWRQHFPIDVSSRALRNESGGVETNTLNALQIELVGTCDPATHRKWKRKGYAHVYWPEAPEWALRDLADFMRWCHEKHGIRLQATGLKWPSYPDSYGNRDGHRMTNREWLGFYGWCGHMHVPENTHGDPGSLPIEKVLAMARGEDDNMPSAEEVAHAVWTWDHVPNLSAPKDSKNPTWTPKTFLSHIEDEQDRTQAQIRDLQASLDGLAESLRTLAQHLSESGTAPDADALAADVADRLKVAPK